MKKTVLVIDYDEDRDAQILFGKPDKVPESLEEQDEMTNSDIKLLTEALDLILNKSNKNYLRNDIVNFLIRDENKDVNLDAK